MRIEISTKDLPQGLAMHEGQPDGVKVTVQPPKMQRGTGLGFQIPPEVLIVLDLGKDVAVGLLSAWIYDKLKNGRSRQLTINRRVVELEKGEIKKVIEEEITTSDRE